MTRRFRRHRQTLCTLGRFIYRDLSAARLASRGTPQRVEQCADHWHLIPLEKP